MVIDKIRGKSRSYRRDRYTGYHPDTIDWKNRVLKGGGGAISQKTLYAVDEFCKSYRASSINGSLVSMCIFVPDNLVAAITPVVKTLGTDQWNNVNFATSDLDINGLKGNASNKYMYPGWNVSDAMTPTSNGMTSYVSETVHQVAFDAGCDGNANGYFEFTTNWSDTADPDGAMIFCDETYGVNQQMVVGLRNPDSNCVGYFSGNRTPSKIEIYFANSYTAHVAHPSGVQAGYGSTTAKTVGLPTNGVIVFGSARYGGTVLSYVSSKRMSMFAWNLGLTAEGSEIFYNNIQLCRQRIGGGWI